MPAAALLQKGQALSDAAFEGDTTKIVRGDPCYVCACLSDGVSALLVSPSPLAGYASRLGNTNRHAR